MTEQQHFPRLSPRKLFARCQNVKLARHASMRRQPRTLEFEGFMAGVVELDVQRRHINQSLVDCSD